MHKLCSWVKVALLKCRRFLGSPGKEEGQDMEINSHPSQGSLGKPQFTPTEAAKLVPCSKLHTNNSGCGSSVDVSLLQRKNAPHPKFSWQEPQGGNISENCGTTGGDQRLNKLVCLPLTCVNNAGLKQKPENPKPAQAGRDTQSPSGASFLGQGAWTRHSHEERGPWFTFGMFGN